MYIPEIGWLGYDPTHGIVVGNAHVALAASHSAAGTAPVEGCYYGEAVASKMEFVVTIDVE